MSATDAPRTCPHCGDRMLVVGDPDAGDVCERGCQPRRRTGRVVIGRLLDALLGPRCTLCGQRVFPRDVAAHWAIDHAGDEPTEYDDESDCGCDVHPRWCAWNGPCCADCNHDLSDECDHDWTLRPESDTRVCETCGAER